MVGFNQSVQDFSGRFDWEARRDDRVVLRYQYSRQKFDNQTSSSASRHSRTTARRTSVRPGPRTFSKSIVGELRYGLGFRDTNVNIKEGNDTPIIRFAGTPVSGSIIGNAGTFRSPATRWTTSSSTTSTHCSAPTTT